MHSLRTRTVLVGSLLLLLLVPLPIRGRLATAAFDTLHLVVGAGLAYLASGFLARCGMRAGWMRDAAAVLLAGVAGGGVELIQGHLGRNASWADAATNVLGAGVWFLVRRARATPVPLRRRAAWVGAGLLVCAGCLRPGLHGYDAVRQRIDFPLLASFEDPLELTRIVAQTSRVARDRAHATRGDWSLAVTLEPGDYPGVTLVYLPEDWRDYDELAFDLHVDGTTPLPLILKVEDHNHDKGHYDYADRFHKEMSLAPGPHEIRIPLAEIESGPATRKLALDEMARLQWFLDGLGETRTFHLDAVRLIAR